MLASQVGHEKLLELQTGVAEVCFNRAFGASDFCCDGFDGQFVVVVEQKDAAAHGGECPQGFLKMLSEFGAFHVTTRARAGFGDAVFVNEMQRFCIDFSLSKEIGDDVFSDAIQP